MSHTLTPSTRHLSAAAIRWLSTLGLAAVVGLGAAIAPAPASAQTAATAPPLVVAHNMVNAWNALDVPGIAALFAEDGRFQSMMAPEAVVGRAAIEAQFAALLADASRLDLQLRNIAVSGEVVFLERVDVFTYRGKEGSVPVVAVLEVRDGKVSEWREYYDRASLLREMGIGESDH